MPPPPTHPTFRRPDGYSSMLDFFLIQSPDTSPLHSSPKRITFWPSYQPHGHAIHICRFPRTPPVSSSSDDLPARNIPTGVFYSPPSLSSSPSPTSASQSLVSLQRSLLSANPPTLASIKARIWAWWHSDGQRNNSSPSPFHYNLLSRKLSHARNFQLTIPLASFTWLISHFPALSVPSIRTIHDSYAIIPVTLLANLLAKYDLLHTKLPSSSSSKSQFSSPPTATWHKCRVAAPKIWAHQGTIKSSDGTICKTSRALDLALRATRSFWQDSPTPYHPSWTSLLTTYSAQTSPFPHSSPLGYDSLYRAVITSPDSAPGADGIPFSAYRVSPTVSTRALTSHFHDILAPVQTLIFIPTADSGDYADNYRPLGLPNSSDHPKLTTWRFKISWIINLSIVLSYCQTWPRLSSESILIGSCTYSSLGMLHYWVLIYCRHILFGRKVLHKVGSCFRPPLRLNMGVDMGRAFSVLLFCVAMDPWYHHVNAIPRVLINKGYMDDNATGGQGLSWLLPAETLINNFHTAGFQVLTHSCYQVIPLSQVSAPLPHTEPCPTVTWGFPSLLIAYKHAPPSPFYKLCSGSLSITVPSQWLSCLDILSLPSYPHLLSLLHCSPCTCKCKTYLIPNFQLSDTDLLFLDSTPFGAKIIGLPIFLTPRPNFFNLPYFFNPQNLFC